MSPTLDTARLRLRPLVDADVAALFSFFGDPEAMRYWSRPELKSIDEAEAMLHDIQTSGRSGGFIQLGIARREDDLVIGTCTLYRIQRDHRRAELGYIIRRDHWGRGLAREALTALLDHAFSTLGLHRLEADVDPRNAASIRLVESLGFKLEGRLRERYFVSGDIQDSAIYGLLAPEWRAR
jgi:Acetyltransferases, including N-acetylases of ribosomal proteins